VLNGAKMKLYQYVGPENIKLSVINFPIGACIKSVDDVEKWMKQTKQKQNDYGLIPTTFVIDSEGQLRLADRHSEHVACAGGLPVFSAGEMFFAYHKPFFEVIEVSNQSTGYCPEPDSWDAVAEALNSIPLRHPGNFTTFFVFRRCPACGQLNIVKNDIFLCSVCNKKLPTVWNCDSYS